jgi:hypothetical protein
VLARHEIDLTAWFTTRGVRTTQLHLGLQKKQAPIIAAKWVVKHAGVNKGFVQWVAVIKPALCDASSASLRTCGTTAVTGPFWFGTACS